MPDPGRSDGWEKQIFLNEFHNLFSVYAPDLKTAWKIVGTSSILDSCSPTGFTVNQFTGSSFKRPTRATSEKGRVEQFCVRPAMMEIVFLAQSIAQLRHDCAFIWRLCSH